MTESNLEATQINRIELEEAQIIIEMCPWYKNVAYYLKRMKYPKELNDSQKRTLKLHASRHILLKGDLYQKNRDGILLFCLDVYQAQSALKELHESVCGGHFSAKTNAHKILNVGYYWPQVFKDFHTYIRICEACQKIFRKI